MARDVAEGFVSVTERTFRQMSAAQMSQLAQEFDRMLRELRGGTTTNEAAQAVQARQHRIIRLNTALMVLRAYRQKSRR